MQIKQAVIHEIIKKEREIGKGDIDLSHALVSIDNKVVSMLTDLDGRYINLLQSRGIFDRTVGLFPSTLDNYLNNRSSDGFIEFTHLVTHQLLNCINKEPQAKGGYLVFVEYDKGQEFVAVFMVRHKIGGNISKDSRRNCYVINDSTYIDVDRLAMAARINLFEYQKGEDGRRYISFINKNSIDSKYFVNWMCTAQLQGDKDDTKLFRKLLTSLTPPYDYTIGRELTTNELLDRVYSYAKLLPKGEKLNLKVIGQEFFGNENALTSFADQANIPINHEFKPDADIMRRFVKIKVKADDITLDFPSKHIDKNIVEVIGNKVIINSEKLANQITIEQKIRQYGDDNTSEN